MGREAIPLHRHPPPLLHRRFFRPVAERLRPQRPELIEDVLIEVGGEIRLREQQLPAPRGIRRLGAGGGQRHK